MTYLHVLKSQIVNKLRFCQSTNHSVSELGDQPLSANCGSPRDMGLRIIMKEGQETIFMCGSFGFQNFNCGSQTCTVIGVNQVIFPIDHNQEKVEFLSGNLDSGHFCTAFP